MDLITELPGSKNHDVILVCVDRFSKMAHFIPTRSDVTAEQTAALYVRKVFRLHGLPKDVVSDRGQQFTSRFTKRLLELCEINLTSPQRIILRVMAKWKERTNPGAISPNLCGLSTGRLGGTTPLCRVHI